MSVGDQCQGSSPCVACTLQLLCPLSESPLSEVEIEHLLRSMDFLTVFFHFVSIIITPHLLATS